MKRSIIMLAVLGLIPLLAACGSATPPPTVEATDTSVAAASPAASSPATSTPASVSEEATQVLPEAEAAFPTPNPNPECVVEAIPEDPNVPQVTADEWSTGPGDALVTLIEYGDFQ